MEFGPILFVVVFLVIAIWLVIELKRLRHKIFAIFLIGLILFTYFSFTMVIQKHDVELTTIPGMIDAAGLYVSWLGSLFGNFKSITSHAIGLDWAGNETGG